jgi:hypothetical protein
MITLVFLVCVESGCFAHGPPIVYSNLKDCYAHAEEILKNVERANEEEGTQYNVAFQCLNWGVSA